MLGTRACNHGQGQDAKAAAIGELIQAEVECSAVIRRFGTFSAGIS